LTHFVAANQNDWYTLALAHTYEHNSQGHAATGFSTFELVLSGPPTVGVMETRPISASHLSKPEFSTTFLRKVQQIATTATESIRRQQQRYKEVYDALLRERNRDICPGDLVFVKSFSHQTDISPKLLFPASGPYVVINRDSRTMTVKTPSGPVRINCDRVTRAPAPEDLPSGVKYQSSSDTEDEL
jgi:hypothetical protein